MTKTAEIFECWLSKPGELDPFVGRILPNWFVLHVESTICPEVPKEIRCELVNQIPGERSGGMIVRVLGSRGPLPGRLMVTRLRKGRFACYVVTDDEPLAPDAIQSSGSGRKRPGSPPR